MTPLEDRRYSITEVSQLLDLPAHVLRHWEKQFPQIKAKRDNANRRYYNPDTIRTLQRIKQLVRNEKMTLKGAEQKLQDELNNEDAPRTNQEALEIIDQIEKHARNIIHILDSYEQPKK